MQPIPYLFFNGTCAAAIEHYKAVLGAEVEVFMPASAMPADEMPIPADRADWVMHATLTVGTGQIMMSDSFMDPSDPMAGCSVQLSFPTVEEARQVFEGLAAGGVVTMPFEATFWAAGFGTCTDRFGIRWMVGTDGDGPA